MRANRLSVNVHAYLLDESKSFVVRTMMNPLKMKNRSTPMAAGLMISWAMNCPAGPGRLYLACV
ncbi:hypothetical protein D3C71_2133800 [compost metagenome]